MPAPRPFALVDGGDAWLRAAHADTFLDLESGVVELGWRAPDAPPAGGAPSVPVGLAFDAGCRLYRSDPAAGQVTRVRWDPGTALDPRGQLPPAVDVFAVGGRPDPAVWVIGAGGTAEDVEAVPSTAGSFRPERPAGGPLRSPLGVAVDADDRLFVAETGAARVLVYDLWSRRLLRAVPMPPGARPLDLAADGRTVWGVARGLPKLLRMTAREGPDFVDLPPEAIAPTRLAVSPSGEIAVLVGAGTDDALVVPVHRPRDAVSVPRATDLEWEADEILVVARFPGEDFARFRMTRGAVEEQLPLMARGWDGGAVARAPGGRIVYTAGAEVRAAAVARVRFRQRGTVTTFRLDAGEYRTAWGRLFLDACIPVGAAVRVAYATSDEALAEPELARTPPGNLLQATVHRPDLSPPMPPLSLVPAEPEWRPLHRRESGRELPWVHPGKGDPFVTYEAPVLAPPGRYLWVTLELSGNSRVSPRVRSVRVERPGHDLMRRLPKTFSRDPGGADFLRRYLAIADGLTSELEARAAWRQILLDPHGTPEDLLPWLASFVGLALDERWPVASRRTLIAEAAWLFRFRGTVPGLSRFLEIYLGEPVTLLEHYRLRGLGGAIVGESGPASSRAILGAGFRVGGAIADAVESPLSGTPEDAFRLHAHRFTVLVRGNPTAEQSDVIRLILDVHRPAHTVVDVCALGAGMRLGRGLHLGLSSVIGRTGGWDSIRLGGAILGGAYVLGRPEPGTVAGASRLGRDTRVG